MRIAYVCCDPGVPVFGNKGSSIHVQEISRALIRLGARVELFAARVGGDPPLGLESVRVRQLPRLPRGDGAIREWAALAANRDLTMALEAAGQFDLIYERYSLWSFAGMEHARMTETPGLLEVNAPLIEEQAQYRGLVHREHAVAVAERAFGAATALLAVSAEVAAYLEQYSAARGRVHVLPNGVDPDRFPEGLSPARPGRADAFTVGFVGTLKPWHGVPILIEAFDRFRDSSPEARLLLVGDGPERARTETALADRRLLGATHLTGAVNPGDIPRLLAAMDVAVAPYPELPGFYFSPLKVYEYMAAGIPVVASRIGQLTHVIRDGVDGLLCPPGDASALAAALERLRAQPGLRARLGAAGRAAVLRDHTWEGVARRALGLAGNAARRPLATTMST